MSDKVDTSQVPDEVRQQIIKEALAERSETAPQSIDPNTVECGTCGKTGFPSVQCKICGGRANVMPRQYTLSEERSGRAPVDDRYGDHGEVGPKIIDLPGSAGRGGAH